MLGLDLSQLTALLADLNLTRVVGGRSRKPSKTVNVPPHDSYPETAKPSFGNGDFSLRWRALLIVQDGLRRSFAQFELCVHFLDLRRLFIHRCHEIRDCGF